MRAARLLLVAFALLAFPPLVPASPVVTALLPALHPSEEALADHDIVRDPRSGALLLRFTNAIVNVGDGPLVVQARGDGRTPAQTLDAVQRIAWSDGSTSEMAVGTLVYHAAHKHFHLAGMVSYALLDEETGTPVASAQKVSFCLADVEPLDPAIPAQPTAPRYNSCAHNARAASVTMGISVGWADVYDRALLGQSFDVTPLMSQPARWYVLEARTDPDALLAQGDPGRPTVASVRVLLGEGVPVGTGISRPGV